jgi:hypothetical protein
MTADEAQCAPRGVATAVGPVIVFGSSIMVPEVYERHAAAGIRRVAEADTVVVANAGAGPVARSYNLILDHALAHDDLEAVVLLHQDAEIVDAGFCAKLRRAFSDPDVAVVGCVGAVGTRALSWWEGAVSWGGFVNSLLDFEEGDMPVLNWHGEELEPDIGTGEVDTLDGFLMALSPWAARTLRFDETLAIQHGYDVDICLQARAAGKKVLVEDLHVVHHHPVVLVTNPETWMEAHAAVADKWDDLDGVDPDDERWKQRARQAEAEAGAARLAGASKLLQAYARAEEHQSEMKALNESRSWRMTEPLRRLNELRRQRRAGQA